jgi:uncharacterized membrane protein HdeD (DUF308 family)
MNKRPLSVTLLSVLIAAAGALGVAYHLTELNLRHPFQNDVVWVGLIRLVAIVCGVYMLRGSNWARWLAMVWIGFHVVISGFHSLQEFAFHGLLFAVFAYVLFRPQATEYFRTGRLQ